MMMSVQGGEMLKKLEEKNSKMWVDAAAKIARAWRREGKLRPLYIVDSYGKGRELVHSRIHHYHGYILR
jgi:hypothetical protein